MLFFACVSISRSLHWGYSSSLLRRRLIRELSASLVLRQFVESSNTFNCILCGSLEFFSTRQTFWVGLMLATYVRPSYHANCWLQWGCTSAVIAIIARLHVSGQVAVGRWGWGNYNLPTDVQSRIDQQYGCTFVVSFGQLHAMTMLIGKITCQWQACRASIKFGPSIHSCRFVRNCNRLVRHFVWLASFF